MFQDMQIPAMVSTDQKVVDTLDELIRDLQLITVNFAVNQNVYTGTQTYALRGNGIMTTMNTSIVVPAGTYTGSDVVFATDNNRYYLKLATTTVGEVKQILNHAEEMSEWSRTSIIYTVISRKYEVGGVNIFGLTSIGTVYIIRGAKIAANPDDDEVYLISQSLYNTTTNSISVASEMRMYPTSYLLTVAREHLPEEI